VLSLLDLVHFWHLIGLYVEPLPPFWLPAEVEVTQLLTKLYIDSFSFSNFMLQIIRSLQSDL